MRETRGALGLAEAAEAPARFAVAFDTESLRPGRHRGEINRLIEHVRWFAHPGFLELDVEDTLSRTNKQHIAAILAAPEPPIPLARIEPSHDHEKVIAFD